MKLDTHIEKVLQRLEAMKRDPRQYAFFNPPAKASLLVHFEKKFGITLPLSYTRFLRKYNGGMFLHPHQSVFIQCQADYDLFKANAVYLMGIEEITEKYADLSGKRWKIENQHASPYPIIPFCTLPNNELLIFVHSRKAGSESPVFDAFHEEFPDSWGLVAQDFASFLSNYLDNLGHPEIIGDELLGVVADYIEEVDTKPNTKTKEMPIASNEPNPEPENAFEIYEKANKHKDAGEYKEAYELISKSIKLDPHDPFYYFIRGEILTETAQHRAALIDFDVAVKLAPTDTLYLCCRAGSLFRLNKVKAAFDDCNAAIDQDSEYLLAYMMRKEIYEFMGMEDKAEADQRIIDRLEKEE
ncbi:MAG: SMI1/KNR4 family protein [Bacteroidales bacterium]|nr:SMI1/KNR4 family protein [Bacteroidales bacterium]